MSSVQVLTVPGTSLLDWLISRGIINKQWNSTYLEVKPQIDRVCQLCYHLDEFEPFRCSTDQIHYFMIEEVIQALAGDRGHDDLVQKWRKVAEQLRKIYIAHSSYVYVHISKWETKNVQEGIKRLDSQILNSKNLVLKYRSGSEALDEKLRKKLLQINVNSADVDHKVISHQILTVTQSVLGHFDKISDSFRNIKESMDFYYSFCLRVVDCLEGNSLPLVDLIFSCPEYKFGVVKLKNLPDWVDLGFFVEGKRRFDDILEGEEASLLEVTSFRLHLLSELLQMREFFLTRICEQADDFSWAHPSGEDLQFLRDSVERIQEILDLLEDDQFVQLLRLRCDPDYRTEQTCLLVEMGERVARAEERAREEESRVERMTKERDDLDRRADLLEAIRRDLHGKLEEELTRHCRTRVRITEGCFDI